jgi:hypothetical protein
LVGGKWSHLFPPLRRQNYSFHSLLKQAHHLKMTPLESWMPLHHHSMRIRVSMQGRRHLMTFRPLYWRS